ncbi:hypothetical protein D1871_03730 [Nakamurella silvestris]|nr:hypothetical protein D1871_03730 [Nakamurella silvestris]
MTAEDPTPALPPIRRQIVVAAPPTTAFQLWTAHINRWWPVASHSVFGETATVAFTDGEIVETAPDGRRSTWGTVLSWEPGSRLVTTWHPGGDPALATEVEVIFEPVAVGGSAVPHTLVTLIHRGWQNRPGAAEVHTEYGSGWQQVLAGYGASRPDEVEYLILLHGPGPNAPADGTLPAHPDFRHHPAFLERLDQQGVLLAAGPTAPVGQAPTGTTGMTVLRIPAGTSAEYLRQATEEDLSVTHGLLSVQPQVWRVALGG